MSEMHLLTLSISF